jgi:hypothetical protein
MPKEMADAWRRALLKDPAGLTISVLKIARQLDRYRGRHIKRDRSHCCDGKRERTYYDRSKDAIARTVRPSHHASDRSLNHHLPVRVHFLLIYHRSQ